MYCAIHSMVQPTEIMNSGAYKFEKPETVEEKHTVSLYNLTDHSDTDLNVLLDAINERIGKIEPYKLAMSETYTTLTAWANLIHGAMRDKTETK